MLHDVSLPTVNTLPSSHSFHCVHCISSDTARPRSLLLRLLSGLIAPTEFALPVLLESMQDFCVVAVKVTDTYFFSFNYCSFQYIVEIPHLHYLGTCKPRPGTWDVSFSFRPATTLWSAFWDRRLDRQTIHITTLETGVFGEWTWPSKGVYIYVPITTIIISIHSLTQTPTPNHHNEVHSRYFRYCRRPCRCRWWWRTLWPQEPVPPVLPGRHRSPDPSPVPGSLPGCRQPSRRTELSCARSKQPQVAVIWWPG